MNYLKVNLWGNEIGRLVWNPAAKAAYFVYNPANAAALPDVAPLLSPAATRNIHLPIYGDTATLYQGLPPFIADSLPDSWGNTLFEIWAKENKIPRNKITPLYKLMFIGTRGMGALEYQPCASDLNHTRKIDISALYDLALKILDDRENIVLDTNEQLTMQALLAVGTSAGGRQTKAIIAINEATGEIRSGQSVAPDGFEYHIMKFGSREMPMAEIETAYYHMARTAGIEMEQCRLFPVEGINHFLTKRFDRKNGKKIHTQTLAAINPEAHSYEDLIATCRELSVTESEIKQIFVRMAFNVIACNTDDHNKNFSFLLEKGGQWRLAPAYDMTFIFNDTASGPNSERRMSIGGKTSAITKDDLIEIALQNGIKKRRINPRPHCCRDKPLQLFCRTDRNPSAVARHHTKCANPQHHRLRLRRAAHNAEGIRPLWAIDLRHFNHSKHKSDLRDLRPDRRSAPPSLHPKKRARLRRTGAHRLPQHPSVRATPPDRTPPPARLTSTPPHPTILPALNRHVFQPTTQFLPRSGVIPTPIHNMSRSHAIGDGRIVFFVI